MESPWSSLGSQGSSSIFEAPWEEEFSSPLELCSSFLRFILDYTYDELSSASLDVAILREILSFIQTSLLRNENINTVLTSMNGDPAVDHSILRTYFQVCALTNHRCTTGTSELLASAQRGQARLFALFNGQGVESYFDELVETHTIYEEHLASLMSLMSETLVRLAADDQFKEIFLHGLDVQAWLAAPDTRPPIDYLTTAAVSLPLIAVSQLVQYAVACINLGVTPGEMRQYLYGASGHSQGVVVAAFLAAVTTWDSFYTAARQVIEVLFWIGTRCQQTTSTMCPNSGLERSPSSYMLSIKGIPQTTLQRQIDQINAQLPAQQAVHLALVNGPQQFVVAGLQPSLQALERILQLGKNGSSSANTNSSRIPFRQRAPIISTRFLPIGAPFHSPYLQKTEDLLLQDLAPFTLRGADLAFPVYHTETAENLQSSENIIPQLIQMICTGRVEWEMLQQKVLPGFTHLLDFGPGGDAGIGSLVSQHREGTGLRTMIVSAHRGTNTNLDYAGDFYARYAAVRYSPTWFTEYAPSLILSPSTDPQMLVDTKFTRVIGLPPVMVAGMTPTTTSPDFVAAILNAGYHAEIACGGFPDAGKMREGLKSLAAAITPGRGITCNVIYANPRAMAWQIPLLAELRRSGVPITGLTIGAGVPSPETVQSYIDELELEHLSLKPGSKGAIDAVLEIARLRPNFPIILQWTGGRGGGHHSYEDFHEPILDRYAQIRACSNVILVAGSGFGDGEGSYPYLSGTWSETLFGRPRMPFDAILLGSRVMTAKEARTSLAVKQALCDIPGVGDADWEGTYKKPTGGILTVRSEMGEPIHKVATRGVKLWAELDRDIFSLPRGKQKDALLARKDYYIRRLNEDFQKVWFGRDVAGAVVDLQEMTYAEVWQRMVELLYLPHLQAWIDTSFRTLVWDWTRRMEERLGSGAAANEKTTRAVLRDPSQLNHPHEFQEELFAKYPQAKKEVITAADADYVVLLSRRRGQKPVPYIVALDEDMEYWFKKDSLWQSERLEAVFGQDVGRICILHGPVAAQYTCTPNEPVRGILESLHNYYIEPILKERYTGDLSKVPLARKTEDLDSLPLVCDGFVLEQGVNAVTYRATDIDRQPSCEQWLKALTQSTLAPWCRAIFTEPMIVQNGKRINNPLRRLFAATGRGRVVKVRNPQSTSMPEIFIREVEYQRTTGGKVRPHLIASAALRRASSAPTSDILMTLRDAASEPLELRFQYKPQPGVPSITEVRANRDSRIQQYYQHIWVGKTPSLTTLVSPLDHVFRGEAVVLTREIIRQFAQSICNHNSKYTSETSEIPLYAPLDLAIAVGWRPLMSCLFHPLMSGDFLRLLHLKNSFEYCDGAEPLKEGDCLSSEGRLTSIKIKQGTGKVVDAEGTLCRNNKPAIRIKSTFILLGEYQDYENTFAEEDERFNLNISSQKDIALLKSRAWLSLNPGIDLLDYLHKSIQFEVRSRYSFLDSDKYANVSVEGQFVYRSVTGDSQVLGNINLPGDNYIKNPVTDYLRRHGSQLDNDSQALAQPQTLLDDIEITIPDYATKYGQASGDCNPIHLSELFASYAGHENRVTHGMFTSGYVRALVEAHVAQSDPSRMRSWSCSFDGKVSPGDKLGIKVDQVGLSRGNLLISIQVHNTSSGVKVLSAQATVEQPPVAYVFTGQGSQQPGMGMELEKQSASARMVWQTADEYFSKTYGFSISQIVRDNPKTLTVYFGGVKGRAVRAKYTSLKFDTVGDDGTVISKRVFPDITSSSRSYTFRSTNGLLHQTQFTQPALALMEMARFEDMRAKGVVREDSLFAGHSLGEYVALAAMGRIFSIEEVSALVFYRGLTMQNAVKRDAEGVTDYSMCAVNPMRVSPRFSEKDLHWCVAEIARSRGPGGLLEIVNYNVANMQYVCAGDLRALAALSELLDAIASGVLSLTGVEEVKDFIQKTLTRSEASVTATKKRIVLQRGRATIPLNVNVPFHSSLLRPGVESFRYLLHKHISEPMVDPDRLIGKYIPNLVAKPFELSREYIQGIMQLTKSPVLGDVLQKWPLL
ncbi:fatty acid synthase subunit beta [Aspergillus eucalypticola CBS 122712]|uniref:Fatty acid synthase subunit beta n=1 Tax=Aspergillus eucalypticola (strain CBS 122712 / IBT 29274) TaxID=1448314 RepID=A0A317VGK1_ASPEC|nr:fatty acid synthase subunit beta [Aspergillus eucalypticola CBS 122712]PWY73494.1 fatty acid synthase subunit beta [Aspergillus eucalypticola CBS 122712]